jgi:hypothetical protein
MAPFVAPIDPYRDDYVTVAKCAQAMGISEQRVRRLMKLRVLRTRYAWGQVLVQPAPVPCTA